MFRRRKSFIVTALILAMFVISGGFMHAALPHDHGNGDEHTGGAGETIIWQMFHGALQHNDKKALFTAVEPLILVVLSVIALSMLNIVGSILYSRDFADPRVHDSARMSALRRGVFRYRVFT